MKSPLVFIVQILRWWCAIKEVWENQEERKKRFSSTGAPNSSQSNNTSGKS